MVFLPAAAPFPWRLRYFQPGDRFTPSGMQGEQKVKEYFINRKIPREERRRVPILESDGRIIWLCGERIAAGVGNPDRQGRWVAVSLLADPPHSLPG
jgi:tRNA(Ile)-lysidine synthetase-like protein